MQFKQTLTCISFCKSGGSSRLNQSQESFRRGRGRPKGKAGPQILNQALKQQRLQRGELQQPSVPQIAPVVLSPPKTPEAVSLLQSVLACSPVEKGIVSLLSSSKEPSRKYGIRRIETARCAQHVLAQVPVGQPNLALAHSLRTDYRNTSKDKVAIGALTWYSARCLWSSFLNWLSCQISDSPTSKLKGVMLCLWWMADETPTRMNMDEWLEEVDGPDLAMGSDIDDAIAPQGEELPAKEKRNKQQAGLKYSSNNSASHSWSLASSQARSR